MNKIEDLFKKVNKENIRLDVHKEKLKSFLLRQEYFEAEKESWDWKLSLSSLAFSAFIIILGINFFAGSSDYQIKGSTTASGNATFYNKLERSKNVTPLATSSSGNTLEMVNDNVTTVFYFNDKNVLINSEVINNK